MILLLLLAVEARSKQRPDGPASGLSPNAREIQGYPRGEADTRLCHHAGMARRVLIVDDHAEFRALARALLERDGFEVVGEAIDGAATLPAVAATRPEVVLLDVQLPDANGFDLAQALCEGEGAPVVVMISTHDAADFGGRLERSGARGFISKSRLSGAALAELVS
jgi:DNA-binding NarL/FixJ family response regulator